MNDSDDVKKDISGDDTLHAAASPRSIRMVSGPAPNTAPELPAIESRYLPEKEVGRGGMGRVLLVFDDKLKRKVALKEFLPELSGCPGGSGSASLQESRFRREVQLSGNLEHPSIVPVYDFGGSEADGFFYTMRFIEGRSLAEALLACSGLSDRLHFLPNFRDICNAMAYAHSRRVIHRDLKPANVILGSFGETIVVDWGLAKMKDDSDETDLRLAEELGHLRVAAGPDQTDFGTALGTPSYMAPEQAMGQLDRIDHQSDIYSLGAMLYELLTGSPPYSGGQAHQILFRAATEPLPPVRSLAPDAPLELCAIAQRALEKDKSGRYATCAELAQDLTAYLSGEKVSSYNYTNWELVRRIIARNRLVSGLVVAMAFTLALGLVISLEARSRAQSARRLAETNYLQAENSRKQAAFEKLQADAARAQAEDRERETHYQLSLSLTEKAVRSRLNRDFLSAGIFAAAALVHNPYNPWSPHRYADIAARSTTQTMLDLSGAQSLLFQSRAQARQKYAGTLTGHTLSVHRVAVSPDGRLLASGSNDRTIRLWDVKKMVQLAVLPGHGDQIRALAFSPDGRLLASGSYDRTVKIWDVPGRRLLDTIQPGTAQIETVDFSPDGRTLAFSGYDRIIRIWNLQQRKQTAALSGHAMSVLSLDFSPDGKSLASAGWDRTIRLWDLAGAKQTALLTGHEDGVYVVRFSPDGRSLASGGNDRTIRIWDVGSARLRTSYNGHDGYISDLFFLEEGRGLLSSGEDRTVRLREPDTGRLLLSILAHDEVVRGLAPVPGTRTFFTSSADGTIRKWEPTEREIIKEIKGFQSSIDFVLFTPDGNHLIFAGFDGGIHLWNLKTDQEEQLLLHHELMHVAMSHSGRLLASASTDGTVKIRELDGKPVRLLPGHERGANCVAFSPDDRLLATGSGDHVLRIWELATGKPLRILRGHTEMVWSVAFSPDGRTLASSSTDRTIRLWDVASGRLLNTIVADGKGVSGLAFSPDGRTLASSGKDWNLRTWDAKSGKLLKVFQGHRLWVTGVVFSPDGRLLASASDDQTARIWDARSGECLLTVQLASQVTQPAFSPDGRSFAVNDDRKVWILPLELDHWKRDPQELLREAEKAAGMHLKGMVLAPSTR